MSKQIIFLFTVFLSFSAFADSTAEQPSTLTSLMPLVLVALILYFIIFRPQMKKEKNREKMVNELKAGDSVVTDSGIHGIISKVNGKEGLILLEISKGNIIKIKIVYSVKTSVGNYCSLFLCLFLLMLPLKMRQRI